MLFLLSLFPAMFAGSFTTEADELEAEGISETGTPGDDEINGTDGDDDLFGGLGADTMTGNGGDDLMQGQGGNDVMVGNDGDDLMQGRGADDTVQGFSGDDWVDGNDGNDFVRGGQGNDVAIGGAGEDAVFGRDGNDFVVGGSLTDGPLSNAQLDALRDGAELGDVIPDFGMGDAQFVDDGEADSVDGGGGNDVLLFGAGDTAAGGIGTDIFTVFGAAAGDDAGVAVIEDYNTSENDSISVFFDENVDLDAQAVTVTEDGADAIISVGGEELARVVGAAGELSAGDVSLTQPIELPIIGTQGDDEIEPGPGDDSVDAGDGQDTILGGAGDDTLNGDGDADIIQGQAGFDRISGNADDDLIQGRGGDDTVSGNQGFDWVDGNDGDDKVNGGLQGDTVIGGTGADLLSGGEGNDVVVGGEVLADPLTTEALAAIRDGEELDDATPDVAIGATITLTDDAAADTLDGGNGSDILLFGAGDTATGGQGTDSFGIIGTSTSDALAVITDYNAAEDTIFILDPSATGAFDIQVNTQGSDAQVLLNGKAIATVTGAAGTLTAADITISAALDTAVIDPNS
ncbi:MAG: calcium-binding protein [Pseudomonadota bacterium]